MTGKKENLFPLWICPPSQSKPDQEYHTLTRTGPAQGWSEQPQCVIFLVKQKPIETMVLLAVIIFLVKQNQAHEGSLGP